MEKPDDYMTLDDFRWTGLKVYLIELAYSIYFARVINNGNIDIKTIINLFEKMLKELLLKEMDNADE